MAKNSLRAKKILASDVTQLLTSVLDTSFRSALYLPLLSPQYQANQFWLDRKIRCFFVSGTKLPKNQPICFSAWFVK